MKHSKLQLTIICVLSLFTAIAFTSCTKVQEAKQNVTDTLKMDSTTIDSVKTDTVKVDSSK